MDWWTPVDIYCERTAAGLWGEPLNAVTNVALVLAGLGAAVETRQRRAGRVVAALSLAVIAIGIGSLIFHTVATRWAALADVLPIWGFVAAYVLFALVRLVRLPLGRSLAVYAAGAAAVAALVAALPPGVSAATNGSVGYLPAVVALAAFTVTLWRMRHPAAATIGSATLVFLVSLTARTVDMALCQVLPIGTHFLWHLLNAAVLALLLRAATRWGAPAADPA